MPMLNAYKAGGAIEEEIKTKYGRSSISNLGYASINCENVPVIMGKVGLSCPYGVLTQIIPNGVGLTPETADVSNSCLVTPENQECSAGINMDLINSDFTEKCYGKNRCSFDFKGGNSHLLSSSLKPSCLTDNT